MPTTYGRPYYTVLLYCMITMQLLTCTLNFHSVPTGTPGMGPKWLDGTIVHTFVLPTQAIPYKEHAYILYIIVQKLKLNHIQNHK